MVLWGLIQLVSLFQNTLLTKVKIALMIKSQDHTSDWLSK